MEARLRQKCCNLLARIDAAGGRGLDHRGDRQRLPGSGSDHGAAHQPGEGERPQRLRTGLHVLYLIFNEGYTSSSRPQSPPFMTKRSGLKRPTGRKFCPCMTLLQRMSDNPMIALNHAVAVAMVHGLARGLELLATLDSDSRVNDHYRLHAVRAHLLEMSGDLQSAIQRYRLAASRTNNLLERNYLILQAARRGEEGREESERTEGLHRLRRRSG